MPRILLIPLLVAGLTVCGRSRADSIQTRAGKTHTGTISLEDGKLALKPRSGAEVSIAPADVVVATFDAPATRPATRSSGWQQRDVGKVIHAPGQLRMTGDRFELSDASGGFRNRKKGNDNFFFVHQEAPGDVTMIARLRALDPSRYARAGIMIRASIQEDAPFVMIGRSSEDASYIMRRTGPGGEAEQSATSEHRIIGAVWLKLERSGYSFQAFESLDGVKWSAIGRAEVPMDESVLVGLASTASVNPAGRTGRTLFDKVQLVAAPSSVSRTPRGVMLKSGSLLACEIESADPAAIRVIMEDGEKRSIPAEGIARCSFVPLLQTHEEKLRSAAAGVLLINGDFLEGQFKGIESRQVKITSVLFGAKSIDTQHEAAALNFRQPEGGPAEYELTLADRSLIRGKSLRIAAGQVILSEPILGEVRIAQGRVREIRAIAR